MIYWKDPRLDEGKGVCFVHDRAGEEKWAYCRASSFSECDKPFEGSLLDFFNSFIDKQTMNFGVFIGNYLYTDEGLRVYSEEEFP